MTGCDNCGYGICGHPNCCKKMTKFNKTAHYVEQYLVCIDCVGQISKKLIPVMVDNMEEHSPLILLSLAQCK